MTKEHLSAGDTMLVETLNIVQMDFTNLICFS